MGRLLFAASLCLVLGSAMADPTPAADQGQVVITGIKDPDMRSYRAVAAGLDAFEQYHHFAPLAPNVRFRLQPRKQSAGPAEPLALRIVSDDDSASIPLAIDADGFFLVPRNQAAYDSKADIVLNQKKGKFTPRAEVRTPGWSEEVRRLGDMRLECRVRLAIGKFEAPFWLVSVGNAIMKGSDWCNSERTSWSITSDTALAGAMLVDGERKLELKLDGKDYKVPIGDKSWPDDTRIELRFAAPAN